MSLKTCCIRGLPIEGMVRKKNGVKDDVNAAGSTPEKDVWILDDPIVPTCHAFKIECCFCSATAPLENCPKPSHLLATAAVTVATTASSAPSSDWMGQWFLQ